jgi:AbrB family looped-hinge helix DNA binding protein
MTTVYSTMSAKGQVTLPAAWRRRFGFLPGQKVAITASDQGVTIEAPPSLPEVRQRIEAEMRAQGTWGTALTPSDAWPDDAAQRHA